MVKQEKNKYKNKKLFKHIKTTLLVFLIVSVVGTAWITYSDLTSDTSMIPKYTDNYYVNDYSNVYSETTESFLTEQAKLLYEKTGTKIIVAAVPETYTESLNDFSIEMANKWGVIDYQDDNQDDIGIFILYTTKKANVRLEVGYGLRECLTDEVIGRILDNNSLVKINDGKWNQAAIDTWIATAKIVYKKFKLEVPGELKDRQNYNEVTGSVTDADAKMPKPIRNIEKKPMAQIVLDNLLTFWQILFVFLLFVFVLFVIGKLFHLKGSNKAKK